MAAELDAMSAPLVIATLAVLFVVMGIARAARDGSLSHPQTRIWLMVGVIFAVMAAYSFYSS